MGRKDDDNEGGFPSTETVEFGELHVSAAGATCMCRSRAHVVQRAARACTTNAVNPAGWEDDRKLTGRRKKLQKKAKPGSFGGRAASGREGERQHCRATERLPRDRALQLGALFL